MTVTTDADNRLGDAETDTKNAELDRDTARGTEIENTIELELQCGVSPSAMNMAHRQR